MPLCNPNLSCCFKQNRLCNIHHFPSGLSFTVDMREIVYLLDRKSKMRKMKEGKTERKRGGGHNDGGREDVEILTKKVIY